MNILSLSELITKANNNTSSIVVSSGASKYSFSVVNNINGKRVTISKALSTDLSLESLAYFLPVEETGQLLISAAPIGDKSYKVNLKGLEKKISYNASLVKLLTEAFNLDFSNRTSWSFSIITIDKSSDNAVAIVDMSSGSVDTQEA